MSVRRVFRPGVWSVVVLFAAPCVSAQVAPPAAPVPAPILSAHTVFLANGGMDATSMNGFRALGVSDAEPYGSFYAAMQTWGRYQLASAPADADLVIELSVTAEGCGAGTALQDTAKIYDAKTHFLLWTVTQPVKPANLKSTWRKNIAAATTDLVTQLKALTASAPAH